MKLIIAGNRDRHVPISLIEFWITQHHLEPTQIVSGRAKGIDGCGENYAQQKGLPVAKFKADWEKYGRGAGPIRNKQMADYGDALLAFWDGQSRGTKNMIEEMRLQGKPVYVVQLDARERA